MKRLSMLATVVLVVLMMQAWGVTAVNVSPLVFCEPNCTGVGDGTKVENPRNCSEYYYCNDGEPLGPIPCDSETHFSDTDCVPGEECENGCSSKFKSCSLTCSNNELAVISDAFNCSVFYICMQGQPVPLECPTDLPHFDESTESCVNDKSVCCSGYCEAYCDSNDFFLVPDPNDCTRYFICDEEGPAKEKYHLQCNGGYFSVQLGACVSETPPDPCPTLCGTTSGASSTTTTTTTPSSSTTTTTTTPSSSTTTTTTTPSSSTTTATTTPSSTTTTTTTSPSSSTTTTTTTPSSSTTTTTTTPGGGVTDINGCVSSLVCTDEGYFAACSTCQREYFSCSGAGALGVMSSCPGDTVFNPTSGYSFCILPSNCPYQ